MNSRFAIAAVFIFVMLVGCGPESDMGFVTGVVTLDGKPVGNASVTFHPVGGRSSSGYTYADGKYELAQTRNRLGAAKGKHTVTVKQEEAKYLDEGIEPVKIPRKYTNKDKTDLEFNVEGGNNEIDIKLLSK